MSVRKKKNAKARGSRELATKRKKPTAKTASASDDDSDLFGFMANEMKNVGDVESPVVPLK